MPQLRLAPLPGKRLEHQGIKVQLIGQIELLAERGQIGKAHSHDFVSLGEKSIIAESCSFRNFSIFKMCKFEVAP